jgi:hypothetical protein
VRTSACTGPNGFYRELAGEAPDIRTASAGAQLLLAITNSATTAVQLTLTSAYDDRQSHVTIRA